MDSIKLTCLHDKHIALGAQMSPFGGFDMPIQYEGIVEEHNAVRTACGIFDVSHMGEVLVSGADAQRFVNHIFTNDVTGAPRGKCLYGMMLHPDGGTVDDLLVYVLSPECFLLVINAANIDKDVAWINEHANGYNVTIEHLSDHTGEIAVQGSDAEAIVMKVTGINQVADLAFYTFGIYSIEGHDVVISRTGYTGEDGFELYSTPDYIRTLWDQLLDAGAKPCGLGCRDTLRFEVGLPLYGDELTDEISPLEAALGIFVKTDKEEFIGRDAIISQKENGVARKIVGLEILDRAIARHGTEVLDSEGNVIGQVTTGYRGISVEKSIAMALINVDHAKLDTQVQVRIRRKVFPAVVTSKKFYKKNYKK